MATFMEKLGSAVSGWNAFKAQETEKRTEGYGMQMSYGGGAATHFTSVSNERNVVSAIYAQLAIDVASVLIRHVKVDENDRFVDYVSSGLDSCFNLEANIDQAGTAFRIDIAMSLFDNGVIAIVPVDTDLDPDTTGSYTIKSMRVGNVVGWFPRHVLVNLYNDRTGTREDVYLSKSTVAIVQNPLYSVMNEPNSTLKRLVRKLSLIDTVDEQAASGKLDIIIQLPYALKSDAKKEAAEDRRKDLEWQLKGSQYGIAYTDISEKITQLNRPAENNLMKQIETLSAQLYAELGLTADVFNGTADEATMINYYNRTVDPIVTAIAEEIKRTFLTKTAVTQGHSIQGFRNPFKLVPISQMAEIADKMTRNEILSSNDVRAIIGFKPSKEKGADDLRNSNLKVGDTAKGDTQSEEVEGSFEKIPPKQLTPTGRGTSDEE